MKKVLMATLILGSLSSPMTCILASTNPIDQTASGQNTFNPSIFLNESSLFEKEISEVSYSQKSSSITFPETREIQTNPDYMESTQTNALTIPENDTNTEDSSSMGMEEPANSNPNIIDNTDTDISNDISDTIDISDTNSPDGTIPSDTTPYRLMLKDYVFQSDPLLINASGEITPILTPFSNDDIESILVSIKDLSEKTGICIDWLPKDKTLVLKKDSNILHMGIRRKTALFNDIKRDIPHPPVIIENKSYVPLSLICDFFGYSISQDSSKKIIEISQDASSTYIEIEKQKYIYVNNNPILTDEILVLNGRAYLTKNILDKILKEDLKLEFLPESRIFQSKGKPYFMNIPTLYKDKNIYIPLASFAKAFSLDLTWASNTKTFHVYYKKPVINSKDITSLIPEHFVYANINDNTPIYNGINGKILSYVKKGKVEVVRDKEYKWYYIKGDKYEGWTKASYLSIEKDTSLLSEKLSKSESEYFVNNYFKLTSPTNQLVWVDLKRQLINIYVKSDSVWKLEKTIQCATGQNISPTIKGTFAINNSRGPWMPAGKSKVIWVKNYVGFYSSYYFHSVKVKKDGTIYDGTVGTVASAGCIRMSVENSEWFYKNIQTQTTVFIR